MGHGTLSAAKIEQAGRNQRRADTPDLMMLMHLVAGPPLHVTGQIPCICFRTCLLVCTWPGLDWTPDRQRSTSTHPSSFWVKNPKWVMDQSDCSVRFCSVLFITMNEATMNESQERQQHS